MYKHLSGSVYRHIFSSGRNITKQKTNTNAPNLVKVFSSSSQGSKSPSNTLPEPPTNCCMSGCANCVWIDYAESLMEHYKDGGAQARADIERLVTDPSLKMFIRLELNSKLRQKEEGK